MSRRLRGFWLLGGAVGLAVVAMGATLVKAELQLARVEDFLDREQDSTAYARADAALAEWGAPWLDTWLRRRGLPAEASSELRRCMEDYVHVLDDVSLGTNIVRFDSIDGARIAADRCVDERLGPGHGDPFVGELQQRWGVFLETRGDTAPRFGKDP